MNVETVHRLRLRKLMYICVRLKFDKKCDGCFEYLYAPRTIVLQTKCILCIHDILISRSMHFAVIAFKHATDLFNAITYINIVT